MFCSNCGHGREAEAPSNFCANCGADLHSDESSGSDLEHSEAVFDEESLIKYYYHRGFAYKEILKFLEKHHNHCISYCTLLRRLQHYGLRRKQQVTDNTINLVRERISTIIDGPGSSEGYRSLWHRLELEGLRVPRAVVAAILKELDPQGTELRKSHRLKRRVYRNPGPNYAWHIDGYDKLKVWGFPIHGCIDGYSRRILWLSVLRSNNLPDGPASLYLTTVSSLGGCPVELISDLGTENGMAGAMQSFFRDNIDAHRYVTSQRNQRIECWWSFLSKQQMQWWRSFFADLESQGILNSSSEISMECLWYCFSPAIQIELDTVVENWNSHYIRKSRHDTVNGRPDSLFFLPEHHGTVDRLVPVSEEKIQYASTHVIEEVQTHELQDYFEYVRLSLGCRVPDSWQTALDLYNSLLEIAEHGTE
ncbi:uncharacterized protein LOC114535679 [Dendronephthya gigantea]|uniref:uncharacterized protein LOC114535679 n=1 Tax=Dendronephthya gigantea TaxID=151771 RepID=UPI00106C8372|nr:uncharacterized protein LOC114535679 [Dendronephthya gigantea]